MLMHNMQSTTRTVSHIRVVCHPETRMRTCGASIFYFTLLLTFRSYKSSDTMKTTVLLLALAMPAGSAFSVQPPQVARLLTTDLQAEYDPLGLGTTGNDVSTPKAVASTAVALAALAASPLAALAEDAEEYEYGAVNAPPGIALIGGVLAILTAALPVLLQGGEKALEQQRIDEASRGGTFGKNADILKKRR